MSSTLATLQREMMDFILRSPMPAPGAHPVAAEVVTTEKLSPEQRLHVYHYGYRARLAEVMQDVFERTWAYLGDEGFEAAAHGFIESAPSHGRTLNRFGESFPAWLSATYPNDIDVAEIATIDWMMRVAFDGADAVPLSRERLAALTADDWAKISFVFTPTLAVAPITHNAAGIWEALERGETPPAAAPLTETTFITVWRKDVRPHFATISEIERSAISFLVTGVSFADTCDHLAARFPDADVVQSMGVWLGRWLGDEMLIDFSVG